MLHREEGSQAIDDGCLCAVAKAECGSEGEVDREEGEEVDSPHHPADAPVARKRKPSDTTPLANKTPPHTHNRKQVVSNGSEFVHDTHVQNGECKRIFRNATPKHSRSAASLT